MLVVLVMLKKMLEIVYFIAICTRVSEMLHLCPNLTVMGHTQDFQLDVPVLKILKIYTVNCLPLIYSNEDPIKTKL